MYFQAYSGSEPYIFVSYCHKDRDRVYPVIEQLHNEGYHIWYDEGIPATEEWRGVINRHIVDCGIFMIFVTNNSMASHEVVKECTFAINMKKKLHIICLDDVPINEIDENLIADFANNQRVTAYNMHSGVFSVKLREPLAKYRTVPPAPEADAEPAESKAEEPAVKATLAAAASAAETAETVSVDIAEIWKNVMPKDKLRNLLLAGLLLIVVVGLFVLSFFL